jgi:signal transduction histidine kinase
MMSGNMRGSRLVLMALAVGAFFTAEEVFMDLANGRGELAGRDIVTGVQFWLIWVVVSPAIAIAVRRWPLNATHVARPLVAHAGIALVLAVIHNVLGYSIDSLAHYARSGGSLARAFDRSLISQGFVWGVFTGVVFYTVVVMLFTALAFRSELAQVKLDTLRSQLRPHFLFNTLNAISVFVGEDTAKARLMILRLSTLLRRSLDQEGHEVPFEEELAFANDYLDIQRGRFGDRLAVVLDVGPDARRAMIPVFLLQPLLENAIEHGMPDDRPMTVTVHASRAARSLHLAVIDNGAGLPEEASRRHRIGNANTRARLEHLYGARASIDWTAGDARSQGPGTRVDIRLPYREMVV